MIRFFQSLLFAVAILLLAWLLPWCYRFATLQSQTKPFIIYSRTIGDFAIILRNGAKEKPIYTDRQNRRYTQAQFDSILPTLYYKQLVADNRLPDTLFQRPITPKLIHTENFVFRHSSVDVNTPWCKLYSLLEAGAERVDLQMPNDVFRFTRTGIEFIDMETNRTDVDKTDRFRKAFEREQVVYPIQAIAGNPTDRKEYDEGYFFTDARYGLFHLKLLRGEPYLHRVALPDSLRITHLFVTEFAGRHHYAFLADKTGAFYVLETPDYQLKRIDIPPFFPARDDLTIFGNMFDWTVKTEFADGAISYTALDASTLAAIDRFDHPKAPDSAADRFYSYLFPFDLRFTSTADSYAVPRIKNFSWQALFLHVGLSLLFVALSRRRYNIASLTIKSLVVVLFGLFAFIPLLLFDR